MRSFRIFLVFVPMFILVISQAPPVQGARGYRNVGYIQQNQEPQNKFTGAMSAMADGAKTAGVWTVRGPYLVGKYVVTEIFRPFVPIRDKLIDTFGVRVEE